MSEEKAFRNKWKGWDCKSHGCWKKQAVAETKSKQSLTPKGTKPKVKDTPPSPNRVRRGRPSPRTAIQVWERDKGLCYHCGKKLKFNTVTFDHVIPVCRGGRSYTKNMVLSCDSCNQRRGNKPLVRRGKADHHVEYESGQESVAGPYEIVASVRAGSRKSRGGADG